uniref:PRELI/MSF1 domain-containing protein n=1 Tax=Spongospora subterranea TaxID=70186 RepID=A0A0H5RAC6_9EUKA|eukprot:CRZ10746.1 hypothetical protein [Spongospora subterranea]
MRSWFMVVMTAAIGTAVSFGVRGMLRRRRQRSPPVSSSILTVSQVIEAAPSDVESPLQIGVQPESSLLVINQNRSHIFQVRIRPPLRHVELLLELLIIVISVLLAWVISNLDQSHSYSVLLRMLMTWAALRYIVVSLPTTSQSSLTGDNVPSCRSQQEFSDPEPAEISLESEPRSLNPELFLGSPPRPLGDGFTWLGPFSIEVDCAVQSVARRYWSFFGSPFMSNISAEFVDSRPNSNGDELIRRKLFFKADPPYLVRPFLNGVTNFEIDERSVCRSRELTLSVYSRNISANQFVQVLDICEMSPHRANSDVTVIKRRGCVQVSDSVGIMRSSVESFVLKNFAKKSQDLLDKFSQYLAAKDHCPNLDVPGNSFYPIVKKI